MDQNKIRSMFPMLKHNITYLDSGALVQKPESVIRAILEFYTNYSISNRTSDSYIGSIVVQKIDETRQLVADLLECDKDEVMFNSGATEGLNYAAMLLSDMVKKDDEILISKFNHSSHMIPWIELAKNKKAKIVFSDDLLKDINEKTKIIAFTQMNNTFNIEMDIKQIFKKAKEVGAILVNDAAQAISHEKVDSDYSDIIAFSSNKFFGPTGLGILYVSKNVLDNVKVKKFGGGALDYVKSDGKWKSKDSIIKHEPGTLNLAGIFGFYEALNFWNSLDKEWVKNYLKNLSSYAYDELSKIHNLEIFSKKGDPIILFEIKDTPSQDVASYLGHRNIYVRSGNFCAQYLGNMISNPLVRVSLHIYNNINDIDKLVSTLKKGGDFLDV